MDADSTHGFGGNPLADGTERRRDGHTRNRSDATECAYKTCKLAGLTRGLCQSTHLLASNVWAALNVYMALLDSFS